MQGLVDPPWGKQCRNSQMKATNQAHQHPVLVKEKDREVVVGIPAGWTYERRGPTRSES